MAGMQDLVDCVRKHVEGDVSQGKQSGGEPAHCTGVPEEGTTRARFFKAPTVQDPGVKDDAGKGQVPEAPTGWQTVERKRKKATKAKADSPDIPSKAHQPIACPHLAEDIGPLKLLAGRYLLSSPSLVARLATGYSAFKCGWLKVGWSICQIAIPQQPERCFRCVEYGHKSFACKGTDRSGLCWRCGVTGHQAASCTKDAKCLHCGGGHRVGNPKSPALQKASAASSRG
ncbi:uncharacterized protein LOC129753014 [Uranotaenia lowii]|uniref:uncharacterized protein LOC129753014 n=1 Tax=Uranotaenia lowii TaxID=190385 RepID=UPI002479B039|nr:uncharacterized protein LOC129753014 [Uranotaenia lowii]